MEEPSHGHWREPLDTERLGDHIVIALVPWRGTTVVVDDLSTVGAAEAGYAAGVLGEERCAADPGVRVPRRLRFKEHDKRGVEALGDGITACAEGVRVLGSGYLDGSINGVEDAS